MRIHFAKCAYRYFVNFALLYIGIFLFFIEALQRERIHGGSIWFLYVRMTLWKRNAN